MSFTRVEHAQHAIAELQGKATTVLAGAAAVTNIPLAGITTNDTLGSVIMFAAGVPSDVSAEASITSNGNIQLATTVSTGNQLLVEYYLRARP